MDNRFDFIYVIFNNFKSIIMDKQIYIKNREAYHEYQIQQEFTAGIELFGPEVKSIRQSNVSIKEAYCHFNGKELFIKGMFVAEYKEGSYNNSDPIRERRLLLNKRELTKLQNELKVTGITIIPLALFINEKGLVKLKIALCRGKKLYDKRNDLKRKDIQRDLDIKIN